jgi:hypothetical protein
MAVNKKLAGGALALTLAVGIVGGSVSAHTDFGIAVSNKIGGFVDSLIGTHLVNTVATSADKQTDYVNKYAASAGTAASNVLSQNVDKLRTDGVSTVNAHVNADLASITKAYGSSITSGESKMATAQQNAVNKAINKFDSAVETQLKTVQLTYTGTDK